MSKKIITLIYNFLVFVVRDKRARVPYPGPELECSAAIYKEISRYYTNWLGAYVTPGFTFAWIKNKKAFQSKVNCPLANRPEYIPSKQVWTEPVGQAGFRGSHVTYYMGTPCEQTDRQTDRTENITFPQIMYAGGNENWALNIQVRLVWSLHNQRGKLHPEFLSHPEDLLWLHVSK